MTEKYHRAVLHMSKTYLERLLDLPDHIKIIDASITDESRIANGFTLVLESDQFPEVAVGEIAPIVFLKMNAFLASPNRWVTKISGMRVGNYEWKDESVSRETLDFEKHISQFQNKINELDRILNEIQKIAVSMHEENELLEIGENIKKIIHLCQSDSIE